MKNLAIAITAAAALVAAPALHARPKQTGEEKLAKILEGREPGEPVSCISLSRVRSSRIIDRTAIVYDAGSVVYVNRPSNAHQLDSGDVMVTRLPSDRLCNVDVVRLRERSMLFPTGFVGLDHFVPWRKVARAD